MSLQEITQGVTRVHTNVKKKTRAVIEQVLYFNTIEDSVYCIEMYEAFFSGDTSIIYLLYPLPPYLCLSYINFMYKLG